ARSLTGRVPGTRQVMSGLRERGVRIAGLTNWSAETFPVALEILDELAWLETIVVSGEEGVAKPDPRIWRITEERLGVTAADIVFADDSAANVESALAAGWDAIRFTD